MPVQRTADTADTPTPDTPIRRRGRADTLRYIPPVAALGTAFILQIALITDTVGTRLADRWPDTQPVTWYMLAGVLGLLAACCVEGGAAYLMDLYDKHLLAGDSVWLLRLSMVVYVAGSGAAVHWWAGQRDLPEVVSWLLAGMSASALFLWSRGSRWAQRDAMRAAGQLDPAMPRFSVAAKALHPIRWLVTVRLIAWNPVATVADARAVYDRWRDVRSGRLARTEEYVAALIEAAQVNLAADRAAAEAELADTRAAVRVEMDTLLREAQVSAERLLSAARADADRIRAEVSAEQAAAAGVRAEADRVLADTRQRAANLSARSAPDRRGPVRLVASGNGQRTAEEPTVEALADTLDRLFPDTLPGRPSALAALRQAHGRCSTDRAKAAKELLAERRGAARTSDSDDDQEGVA